MEKIAVFVEGLTEQIFICKYLSELGKKHNISIKIESLSGGSKSNPRVISEVTSVTACNDDSGKRFFFLIRNSNTDSKVKSDMIDGLSSLKKAGYKKIIGLRDTFPIKEKEKISKLIKFESFGFPESSIPYTLLYAVAEIEAWFIAENSHFENINNSLTLEFIEKSLNIDLNKIDIEDITHPAKLLHDIYGLVDLAYRKKEKHFQRTIDALDFDLLASKSVSRSSYLKRFINEFSQLIY